MLYRELGRTGLKVSQLGFGCMRLPMQGEGEAAHVDRELAIPMLHRAFDGGVNYFDTAVGYCNQDSQRALGEAMQDRRDKVVLSTKNPNYGEDEKAWWTNLENSLERLRTGHIDIYNHHGLGWQSYEEHVAPRVGAWMRKAREQGLIRHICFSFHDSAAALDKLIDAGYAEVITLQYNMLDRNLEAGIEKAHAAGVGVVVMGPVAGGRLGAPSEVLASMIPGIERVPELALRFVLRNSNVTVALSGMGSMEQVEENLAIASVAAPLTPSEEDIIGDQVARLKKMSDLYCTNCGYCQPCPEEVNIPAILGAYNTGRIYGLWEPAKAAYARLGDSANADACINCGICLDECPQKLDIPEELREAHAALT